MMSKTLRLGAVMAGLMMALGAAPAMAQSGAASAGGGDQGGTGAPGSGTGTPGAMQNAGATRAGVKQSATPRLNHRRHHRHHRYAR